MGGPVFLPKIYNGMNKSFFFVSYQALKIPNSPYLWGHGGLTAAELAGDFSKSAIIPTVTRSGALAPNSPFAGREGEAITDLRPFMSPATVQAYKYWQVPLVENSGDRCLRKQDQVDQSAPVDITRRSYDRRP